MAARYDIDPKATDRNADGFDLACAPVSPAETLVGEDSIMRHRGRTAAGETRALVARCVL